MKTRKILNNKKSILIIVIIIILISFIGGIAYLICNNLPINVSTEPTNEVIEEVEVPNEEEMNIEELEIVDEDSEENVEQKNIEQENVSDKAIKKEESKTTTKTSKNNMPTYYIKVNYGAQVVTVYKKDDEGNYTVPVKAFICSTGSATPTSGVYSIPARWEWLRLQGYVWGHYSTQIKGNILFHSVPYLEKGNLASLEYWEYDKLGTAASAGCVRLTVQDAKWIYDNCAKGTKVEFYNSSNPGPLGKPSAKKISSYADYLRNWDPTDPNSNNPWKTYKETTNSSTATTPNTSTGKTENNTTNSVNNIQTNTTINTTNNITTNNTTNTTSNSTLNNKNNTTISNNTTSSTPNTTMNNTSSTTTNNKNNTGKSSNTTSNTVNSANTINYIK